MTQSLERDSGHKPETIELVVRNIERIAEDCIALMLEKSGGGPLPD